MPVWVVEDRGYSSLGFRGRIQGPSCSLRHVGSARQGAGPVRDRTYVSRHLVENLRTCEGVASVISRSANIRTRSSPLDTTQTGGIRLSWETSRNSPQSFLPVAGRSSKFT